MSGVAETRPLLSSEDSNISDPSDVELLVDQESCSKSHATRVIAINAICTIIADLAGYGSIAPQLQIFEQTICRDYYPSIGVSINTLDQDQCNIEPIQSELALINGWLDTFQTVPGLFLAVPFGAVADRIGRKPVLLAGMAGCLLGEGWVWVVGKSFSIWQS
ncbi:adenylate cyclase [Penicillium longicatenatum]|nr:adenylate cyclase [Penicillium longicatenatum]